MTTPPTTPRTRRKAITPAPVTAPVAVPDPKPAKPLITGTLKIKDLVELVTAAVGGKKKDVKDIVEATLTQMGLALDRGHSLNLPAFGKARVARQQPAASGAVLTLKLRRVKAGAAGETSGKETLAAANDQD